MAKYKNICNELDKVITAELKSMVQTSEYVSKFFNLPAISISLHISEDIKFTEVIVIDDELEYLDSIGHRYSHGFVNFEQLVKLVDFLNDCNIKED